MNRSDEQPIDDWQIERLVDGELNAEEYQSTLRRLDASDDGWRRCALVFLEAQALRQAIPDQLRAAEIDSTPNRDQPVTRKRRTSSAPAAWRLVLATAASFLIAFGLGWAVSPLLRPSPTSPRMAHDRPVDSRAEEPAPRFAESTASSPRSPVRLVVDDGSGKSREVELPMQAFEEAMGQWNRVDQLPPEVAEMLHPFGHDLHRRQQLIPVPLEDGSQLVIPVEQMRIVPVNRSAYQ